MNTRRRSEIAMGALLILAGGWMLLVNLVPDVKTLFGPWLQWPLSMILIGGGMFLFGLVTLNFGLFVPACILAVLGGIFYWQQQADVASWSYAWTLIIGAVGLGITLEGVFSGKREKLLSGLNTMLVSAVLFAIFGTLLGRVNILGPYWPLLLIGLGLILLLQAFWPKKS